MLRYRLLGPLSVERDDALLDLGTPKQRALLAVLVQEAGSAVSTDRIVDLVWGEGQPQSVQSSLHANVSRLRRLLRDDASSPPPIVRRAGGYLLNLDRAEVDVELFEHLAAAAAAAVERQEWVGAVEAAGQALTLWRGGYLDDLRDEEWVRVAAAPLVERRLGVQQNLIVGLLGVGDIAAAVARSTSLVHDHPLAERAVWLYLVALYRAGRTSDALGAFRAFSDRLADDLGLDVGPPLRDLHAAILRQDPAVAHWPGGPAAVTPAVIEPQSDPVAPAERRTPSGAGSTASPLVGRTAELEVIEEALARARTDRASWIVLSGQAGMGKTRLAEEALSRWEAAGGAVARGQCPDLDGVPAWWPIRQLLTNLDADPDAILAPVSGGDVDAARFAVLENVADVVRARLADRPLMLVVDDIHWGDRASLTFLGMLADTVTESRLVVILTTRQTRGRPELDRLLTTLARRPDSRLLALVGLDSVEVAQLVEQVSGKRPDSVDATGLTTRTGGTPFYVVEYARLPPDQRTGDQIPAAVRTVLNQRFAALPEPLLLTLRAAAVIGEPLDVALLAAVTARGEDDVADLLDAAADVDLLMASADSASYTFSHALLRDELEAGVPDLRRRRLHAQAAERLADSSVLADLLRRARHLFAAGPLVEPAQAYAGFRAAASAADERWLSDTAASWWAAAAEALDQLPDADPDERETLVAARLRAMAWAGQAQAVLDVLDAALLDALRAGRTSSVGRLAANLLRVSGSWPWPVYGADPAPLMTTLGGLDDALRDDPGARARVLAVTAIGRCYDSDSRVPDDMSRRAIELAESADDDAVLADALFGRALTYSGVASRSAEMIGLLDRVALLVYDGSDSDEVLRHNLVTLPLFNLGRIEECLQHIRTGAVGADVFRMPIDRVQLRWAEAAMAQWQGDLQRARELYERAETAHRRTDLQQAGTFELADLVLRWDEGRLEEFAGSVPSNPMVSRWTTVAADAAAGRPGCDKALAVEVRRSEPDVWTSHGRLTLLAHCVADRGLIDLASPLLEAMAPVRDCVGALGQIGALGPVALAMARLYRLVGDTSAAHDHLRAAHEISRRSGGGSALLHCRLEAASWVVADDGPTLTVRQEVDALAREADERGMGGVARRARALC